MLRQSWILSLVVVLAVAESARSQDDVPAPKAAAADKAAPVSRSEQLQALIQSLETKAGKLIEALPEEPTEEQRIAAQKELDALVEATRAEVFAFAKADPKDRPALTAMEWLSQFPDNPEQSKAMEEWLLEYHVASPRLGGLLQLLEDAELTPGQRKFLEAIGEKNPFPPMKAAALLTLARSLVKKSDASDLKEAARKPLRDQARQIFQRLQKEFADVESPEGSFGELAEDEIYILENLSIGSKAPEVTATELTGKPVKLSSTLGKVVVLDIWATWCGPCKEMIPHERELVKRLQGKPFALVGLSADDDRQTVTEFIAEEPMPWTHWWTGPEGEALQTLRVQFFPTLYILDAKGVIRFKNLRDEELDKAVDALLKELEAAK